MRIMITRRKDERVERREGRDKRRRGSRAVGRILRRQLATVKADSGAYMKKPQNLKSLDEIVG